MPDCSFGLYQVQSRACEDPGDTPESRETVTSVATSYSVLYVCEGGSVYTQVCVTVWTYWGRGPLSFRGRGRTGETGARGSPVSTRVGTPVSLWGRSGEDVEVCVTLVGPCAGTPVRVTVEESLRETLTRRSLVDLRRFESRPGKVPDTDQ